LSRQVTNERALEIDTFARLMRAHSVLRRELEAEVLSPRGLTINDFETLFHLYTSENGRLRRVDLVGLLMLSPSGVTRLLDGLQAAGLVENKACADDARVVWASITDEGRSTLECVGAEHTELLRSLFRGALGDDEVAQLNDLLGRLPGVGPGSCLSEL
jgi:DNA-binding MarR family transcriptional regulator